MKAVDDDRSFKKAAKSYTVSIHGSRSALGEGVKFLFLGISVC